MSVSTPAVVISDTSVITYAAAVGIMDLFQQLYTTILIPDTVYDELVLPGPGNPGAHEVQSFDWIRRMPVRGTDRVTRLRVAYPGLGQAESEAIILADELSATLLLIDEKLGRTAAEHLGVRVRGLLGVLIEAKARGLVTAIRPIMDTLRNAGFHINQSLYISILAIAGEQ